MIRIITDSSTLFTKEEGKALNIDVVPLSVTINGQTYREFDEIDASAFVTLVDQGHVPTSSQPPIGEYVSLIESYKEDDVLIIAMADGLSGTYQSCLSAQSMCDHPSAYVMNSKTLSLSHRELVSRAVALRDSGHSMTDIVETLESQKESIRSFLLPQDFAFLKRGGRLTSMAATLSGLLKIQPVVMQTEDGMRLEKFAVGRNFNLAIKKILDYLKHEGVDSTYQFKISHAFVAEQAESVSQRIKEQFEGVQVQIGDLSCAFITQGGPRCLAIQVMK